MKLRPHHLLCIQGYEGKGYSPEFIVNMDEVVAKLRAEEGIEIEIVFGTDQICERCPNRIQKNICKTQEKVQQLDAEVIQLLHLKQKKYIYQELINDLNTHITQGILEKICGRCG